MISGNMFLEFQFFLHYFNHVSLWGKVILIFKRHISMEFHKFLCAELLVLMIMKQTLNILSESFAEIWFLNSSVHLFPILCIFHGVQGFWRILRGHLWTLTVKQGIDLGPKWFLFWIGHDKLSCHWKPFCKQSTISSTVVVKSIH